MAYHGAIFPTGKTMLQALYQYIGHTIVFDGKRCQLVEVLEQGPALVFLCPDEIGSIQANQHGDAGRRTPNHYTVPLISELGDQLHPAAQALIPVDQQQALLDYFASS